MAMATDAVEKKLDMSLDAIVEERKQQPPPPPPPPPLPAGNGGKSRNTKRSDRIAQTGPYPPRSAARGSDASADQAAAPVGRRVYVGNLPWSVQWTHLKDHMRAAGEVLHASVLEANGRSKGCGLVEYATEEEARQAIETLNDTEIHGRKMFVREDREARPPPVAVAPPQQQQPHYVHSAHAPPPPMPPMPLHVVAGTRVYVGNLSWNVKWQDLKDHMKLAGVVKHADVLEEPSGRSKGCGLVEFETPEEAQRAIATLNDTELEGRKIFVREDREPEVGSISSIAHRGLGGRGPPARVVPAPRFAAVPFPPLPPHHISPAEGSSLYVGNLPWDVTWQTLKDFFRTVGEVDRTEIAQFPDGRSRGFGIVRFVHQEDAARAIGEMNGTDFRGRPIEVRYDKGRA